MENPTDHLHKEFRTLTMLLTLVTGLTNQHGHPMLLKSFTEHYEGAFERTWPNYRIALNAVTDILARNYEGIAAIVSTNLATLANTDHKGDYYN